MFDFILITENIWDLNFAVFRTEMILLPFFCVSYDIDKHIITVYLPGIVTLKVLAWHFLDID